MSAAFDPYDEWLDIPPEEQPADHYRLLGLARFETDGGRIAAAADERMARLRTYQTGPRGAYTQKLLNELAAARMTLLNPANKTAYDGQLAARLSQLEATRRSQAARPVAAAQAVPAAPAIAPSPPVEEPPKPAIGWQARLLISACVVAVVFALGGLGVSRLTDGRGQRPTTGPKRQAKAPPIQTPQRPVVMVDSNGAYSCLPRSAGLEGDIQIMPEAGGDTLGPWNDTDGEAIWSLRVARAGFFQAQVTYAGTAAAEGAVLEIRAGDRPRRLSLRDTGGLEQFETDTLTIALERSGPQTLTLRTPAPQTGAWLRVRSVQLVPLGANATP